jgi:prolyl oligopeptidase
MAQAVQVPPPTQVEPVTEVLHGIEITDPYRWLEDQNSPRTRKWLEEQAAYTRAYFEAIQNREPIRVRVRELLAQKEVISEPWNVGDRYFFLIRQEDREQPVIVMRDGLFGPEAVLVDPIQRGRQNSTATAVSIAAISEHGRFLAYSVRQGGTDHSSLEILDVERRVVLPDRLPEGFCTGFAFAPDSTGFYYSNRELHGLHPDYRAAFWHRFGTDQSEDRETFFAGEEPNLFLGILDSPEDNLLAYIIYRAGKSPRTSVYLQEMSYKPSQAKLVVEEIKGCLVPFFVRGQLLAYTDLAAPNFRIVLIDSVNPDPAHWHNIVPESDRRIQQFAVAGDQVFVTRTDRFSTHVEVFSLDGRQKESAAFPASGTIDLLNRGNATDRLFYSHTSISKPAAVHCYDPGRDEAVAWSEGNSPVDLSVIAVEETTYTSSDGTSVPLLLAARKDLLHSVPLPTFLTGYGGFGSCVTPRFTAFATFLMERGFLFAVPALRGGSELGEQWHRAGKRENRQNSFNDFVAAAEWLIAEKRCVSGSIAIGGGSNAALLVGAAITQRPDLFRAAICLGPLLDMARYHLFDFAAGWADEYGSPDDEQDFDSLRKYSPYHCVQDRADYPAVLLISGDADTRCNPMHARKMTARLQAATASDYPILLDYKPAWGHTPVQPLTSRIESLTDRLAFICHELAVPPERRRPA